MKGSALPVRVGIVGCGRIVQTVHAAALSGLADLEVVAVCDLDPAAREAVGDRLQVQRRFESWEELVEHADLDAVFVATVDHVGPALGALRAGKHLLVEKPLCFERRAGQQILEAAEDAGVVAMVGYMKRYDWCFEQACQLIDRLQAIRFARVHDFACRFEKSEYLYNFAARRRPSTPFSHIETLLMFASHDFSIVRGALGDPEEVIYVEVADERTLVVGLRCRNGTFCQLELSLDTRYEWFDETLTVYGDEEEVGVRFADPFVPYERATLWRRRGADLATSEEIATGPFEDAFRREWRHFAACVASGTQPRTPIADGLADIELAEEITARWVGAEAGAST